jgi:hypothetical protein
MSFVNQNLWFQTKYNGGIIFGLDLETKARPSWMNWVSSRTLPNPHQGMGPVGIKV